MTDVSRDPDADAIPEQFRIRQDKRERLLEVLNWGCNKRQGKQNNEGCWEAIGQSKIYKENKHGGKLFTNGWD